MLKDRRMTQGWEWYPGTERCHGMELHPRVRSGTRDGKEPGMEQNQGGEQYPGMGEVPRDRSTTPGREHSPGMEPCPGMGP